MVARQKTDRLGGTAIAGKASGGKGESSSLNGKQFDIAAELIRARTRAGMSQSQLAESSGVSRNTLMGYESGRNKPGARELKWLCESLKVTPNRLLYGTETPFEKDALRAEIGITNEDLEAATFAVMLNMLTKDERDAVMTLLHSLLLARHGQDFKKAMVALRGAMSVMVEEAGAVGEAFENALGQERLEQIGKKVESKMHDAFASSDKKKRKN